jgi:hypothetical protein
MVKVRSHLFVLFPFPTLLCLHGCSSLCLYAGTLSFRNYFFSLELNPHLLLVQLNLHLLLVHFQCMDLLLPFSGLHWLLHYFFSLHCTTHQCTTHTSCRNIPGTTSLLFVLSPCLLLNHLLKNPIPSTTPHVRSVNQKSTYRCTLDPFIKNASGLFRKFPMIGVYSFVLFHYGNFSITKPLQRMIPLEHCILTSLTCASTKRFLSICILIFGLGSSVRPGR